MTVKAPSEPVAAGRPQSIERPMRREIRWALIAGIALALGATCAEAYSRLAAPYYAVVASLIATAKPWKIVDVSVSQDDQGAAPTLRLTGEVRRQRADPDPAATVISRIQAGAVAQNPVVFWTVLALWPAKLMRQRVACMVLGIVVFLGLEAATTVCQLLNPLSAASAMLAGNPDPVTPWEQWSRFIEAGGRFVLSICAAVFTAGIVSRIYHEDAGRADDSRELPSTAPADQWKK